MDIQLQDLIEKIKSDGVAGAEAEAQAIIDDAHKKADSIVQDAEAKADSIIKNAKAETARMEKASEDAITQAGRNLILSFRDGINKELSAVAKAEAEEALSPDTLKQLIPEVVKAWAANPDEEELEVLLSPEDLKVLESSLREALRSRISKGLVIRSDASFGRGFRIGTKDGAAFYDFSADEVADLFSSYLNPRISDLMRKAASSVEPEAEKLSGSAESEK